MNYYKFHLGDYSVHTSHLTNDEDLCYRRAIDLYMLQEGPLANDKRTLSKRLRVSEETLDSVLSEFFELTENGWVQNRCEAEIAAFSAKSEKAKKAGSLGGQRKAQQAEPAKRTLSKRQANAKLTTNQEPLTKNQVQTPLPPQTPPAPPSSGGEVSLLEADGVGEGKANPDIPSTTQSKRIAMVFRRRLTTAWTKNEIAAYKKLGTIPEDDLAAVERYYSELWPPDREKNILRHDLVTFLRNFQGEVDRAHSYGRKAAKEPVKRESEFSANTIKRL